ncbi:P-loop NTPase fold protein [Rivularia sp. UHCC 0363]|uniref:P-loop NTPase fold protein n=1 Tax=Rivularia sp. UHCC 0363 TaxID=3110244 RepID=UPI002B1FB694|nr:P-loop NTPase fold protein [Rivularia sp. UHCC 0363]MEA5599317.1 P-loop NTPase fold protein [Rivularia sp. UHCC 0363]
MSVDRLAQFQAAYRNLDLLPLIEPRELERFWVPYGEEAIAELQQLVEDDYTLSGKTIFSGHRGCGKSTLLAEFGRRCRDSNFFVVLFSIADLFESSDVTHTNILYSIAVNLVAEAAKNEVTLSKSLTEPLFKWSAKRSRTETDTPISAGVSAGFDFKFIKGILKTESTVRDEIKQEFEPKISDLVNRLNILVAQIEANAKKKVLVIIDDLDKLDLGDVDKIFKNHIKALFQPAFRIIYTIPIASLRDAVLQSTLVSETNDQIVKMPVSKLFAKGDRRLPDAAPIDEMMQPLCEILQKRISAELLPPEIATRITLYSGGVLRELVRLVNICCRICLRQVRRGQDTVIDETVLAQAVKEIRLDFETTLSKADYETLRITYERFTPDDPKAQNFLDLLHGLDVLEYRNDQAWYDLHPIVIDLMQLKGLIPDSP